MRKYLYYMLFCMISMLVLFGVYQMVLITLPYFSFKTDIDFLLTKQAYLHIDIWYLAFYLHIGSSIPVLLLGWLQFIKPLLTVYPIVHRYCGKLYLVLVLLFSAPSGLVLGFYANGGFWARFSFVLLATLWWMVTFVAYRAIRKGDVNQHIHFMLRSYSLSLSALTLRCYVLILPLFVHLHAKEMYILVAWLSWIPNLFIAEWMIRRKVITFR